MNGRPITLEEHQRSRMVADHYRLYDCCLETDRTAAIILTTAEIARDFIEHARLSGGFGTGLGISPGQRDRRLLARRLHGFQLLDDSRPTVCGGWDGAGGARLRIVLRELHRPGAGLVRGPPSSAPSARAVAWRRNRSPIRTTARGDISDQHVGRQSVRGLRAWLQPVWSNTVRQPCGDSPSPVDGTRTRIVAVDAASAPISSAIFRN